MTDDVLTPDSASLLVDKQGWDEYWTRKNPGGYLYSIIASIYRKFIIRPTLNFFLRREFSPGADLLHAGCGSGEVDCRLSQLFRITGLDISPFALKIFTRTHGNPSKAVHGSIFSIPFNDKSFDGIYNLGVMEHFVEAEIQKILGEFRRVLRDDGKLVLFWPPEFGLSVLFFKGLRGLFALFGKKETKFHPDEVYRIRSKQDTLRIFTEAGFQVIDYSFGPRDAFTYAIVVASPLKAGASA